MIRKLLKENTSGDCLEISVIATLLIKFFGLFLLKIKTQKKDPFAFRFIETLTKVYENANGW